LIEHIENSRLVPCAALALWYNPARTQCGISVISSW